MNKFEEKVIYMKGIFKIDEQQIRKYLLL